MDIEKIKKLIRLANNNPNEHEANLAARKVCKMLADYNFNIIVRTADAKIRSASNPAPYNPFEEMFRKANSKAWNDNHRSEEPFWTQYEGSWFDPDRDMKIPHTDPPKREKIKTSRECSECGNTVVTSDNSQYFICAKCHWKKYHTEKGESI